MKKNALGSFVLILVCSGMISCQNNGSSVGVYYSKVFYSSEDSGDMFGYQLCIVPGHGAAALEFIEYTGGGDPAEVIVLAFELDARSVRFTVAPLSVLSSGDTLSFEGNIGEKGIVGTGRFKRDTTVIVTELEFVRASD